MMIMAVVCFAAQLKAQNTFDIRSLSLGKTSVANSYNIDALGHNPANIQLQKTTDDATVYLNLITNLGFNFNSDFASIDFYDKYFKKDKNGNRKTLTTQDKADIMSKAADGYSELKAGVNLFSIVVNSGIGSMGIALTEKAGSNLRLDGDFVDIALYGYKNNHTYDFSRLELGASWIREVNITYANTYTFKKRNKLINSIAYGISVKPQLGMYYLGTESNNLNINTNDSDIARGTGSMNLFYSGADKFKTTESYLTPSGTGLGIDLGVNADMKEFFGLKNVKLGFSITDIGSIKWKRNTYRYEYDGNFVITDITNQGQIDSLRDKIKGTKTPGKEFSTALPTTLRIGAMYKLYTTSVKDTDDITENSELANISLELIQGVNSTYGSTTIPIIAIGAEWNPVNILSLRAGIVTGGREKFAAGFGLGLDFSSFDLDIGTNDIFGLFNVKKATKLSGGISLKIKI